MPDHPQTIGPYRVLQRLGAGGMGEVFLAYDERLDRQVAIKRVRPEAGTSPQRRERFRREARVSARLNHPAVVQVHDILTEGDAEYIVMEYVEGTNLFDVIESGRLEIGSAIDLAREIAGGLAAAHRLGIVHRDLKAENVLVTRDGHAKISDFGIAKQLLADSSGSLTQGNAVLGTYRTMSPEQARGETVDHRTDLFALGVLLYEALTGVSPFEADNSLATVNRVIHHRQAPVQSLNPAVSAALSGLIDGLLEKDPLLRPQSAGQVRRALDALVSGAGTGLSEGMATQAEPQPFNLAATLGTLSRRPSSAARSLRARPLLAIAVLAAIAALLAGGAYLALRSPREPLYVAVLAPEVKGGGAGELDLLAPAVRVALLHRLAGLEGVSPRDAEDSGEVAASPVQAAKAAGVDEVVRSRLVCRPAACTVSLQRVRGRDGGVIWANAVEVPTDDFSLVTSAVGNLIRQGYPGLEARKGVPDQVVASRDLQEFLGLRRHLEKRSELDRVIAGLEGIVERAPGFVDAWLLEADASRRRFFFSRDRRDLERAFRCVREARAVAPGDPRPLLTLANVALGGGRLDQAESALAELQRLIPGDVQLLETRARLLNARGRPKEARDLFAAAAARHPSAPRLKDLAFMEYQQGRDDDARRHLNEALRLAPGNRNSLSLLAQIELAHGNAQRAADLYSALILRSPGPSEMNNLGLADFLLGRYPDAGERFRTALAQEPRNPVYALNLADTLLLTSRRPEAEALYRRVVELIDHDPSGATEPQFLTVRAQALAHLGRGREAVAAVQEALRLAPDSEPTAFEAALVYCLLGEESSALANADKALKLGTEPRWFDLPWFAPLRAHPEFQALLRNASRAARRGVADS
jgi:eukaryotic-like serine/threonine-protein kinase